MTRREHYEMAGKLLSRAQTESYMNSEGRSVTLEMAAIHAALASVSADVAGETVHDGEGDVPRCSSGQCGGACL